MLVIQIDMPPFLSQISHLDIRLMLVIWIYRPPFLPQFTIHLNRCLALVQQRIKKPEESLHWSEESKMKLDIHPQHPWLDHHRSTVRERYVK